MERDCGCYKYNPKTSERVVLIILWSRVHYGESEPGELKGKHELFLSAQCRIMETDRDGSYCAQDKTQPT